MVLFVEARGNRDAPQALSAGLVHPGGLGQRTGRVTLVSGKGVGQTPQGPWGVSPLFYGVRHIKSVQPSVSNLKPPSDSKSKTLLRSRR